MISSTEPVQKKKKTDPQKQSAPFVQHCFAIIMSKYSSFILAQVLYLVCHHQSWMFKSLLIKFFLVYLILEIITVIYPHDHTTDLLIMASIIYAIDVEN